MLRQPANTFTEFVKAHPELKAWQLIQLKKQEAEAKAPALEKVPSELKTEIKPFTQVEEKIPEPVVEKCPVREIKDEDDLEILKDEEKVVEVPKVEEAPKVEEPKVEVPKVEAPKVEAPKPTKPKSKLDEKEQDYKAKKTILDDLILVAGDENDYTDFVRKHYKEGVDRCLNTWFETHN